MRQGKRLLRRGIPTWLMTAVGHPRSISALSQKRTSVMSTCQFLYPLVVSHRAIFPARFFAPEMIRESCSQLRAKISGFSPCGCDQGRRRSDRIAI
jgi:hypothetical protein